MILALLLLLALLYVPWFYLTKVNKKRDEAPGPYPYPFVGNLHQIFKHEKVVFRALHNMAVKYGPVVTLWFGGKKQVVVSGVEELKEMMHNPAFDGRSWPQKKQVIDEIYTGQTSDINPHNLGVLFASGECWQVLRRFSLRSLRDNGFGKQVAEMYILEEAQYLMDYLRQRIKENPVVTNLDQIFTMMALNIVWQMAAGERFNFDEEGMVQLLTFEQDINETFWSIIFSPLIVMPFLKHLPPMKNVVSNATRKMKKLHSFFDKTIEQHRNSFDGNNIRDVIDAFIAQEASSTKSAHFDQANLRVLLSDLFLAGSETTGKTMEWACLFMILYPEVMILSSFRRSHNAAKS
uniref:Cytochrome P450 3082A1 n=1 Tax=Paracyclopina nana TaxID=565004 RepID=A0A0F7DGY1_PARNA|nr:cytochrome P450 3082A1 [Paracyclopina nana]